MRTCPNPKCKAKGIPNDAWFCPVCGEPFLSEEYLKLLEEKQQLELFDRQRKILLSSGNIDEEKNVVAKVFKRVETKKKILWAMYAVSVFVFCLLGVIFYIEGDVDWAIASPLFGTTISSIVFSLCITIGYDENKALGTLNETTLLTFIKQNENVYVSLCGPFSKSDILKQEVFAPQETEKQIAGKFCEIETKVQILQTE